MGMKPGRRIGGEFIAFHVPVLYNKSDIGFNTEGCEMVGKVRIRRRKNAA